MAVQIPTPAQLRIIAEEIGLDLTDDDVQSFIDLIRPSIALMLLLWAILWVAFPRLQADPGDLSTFVSHLKAVGAKRIFWYVLMANGLQCMAYFGMSNYLAAYLMQGYHLDAGDTALPLTLAGLGVIAGSVVGGWQTARTDCTWCLVRFWGADWLRPWFLRYPCRPGSLSPWPFVWRAY